MSMRTERSDALARLDETPSPRLEHGTRSLGQPRSSSRRNRPTATGVAVLITSDEDRPPLAPPRRGRPPVTRSPRRLPRASTWPIVARFFLVDTRSDEPLVLAHSGRKGTELGHCLGRRWKRCSGSSAPGRRIFVAQLSPLHSPAVVRGGFRRADRRAVPRGGNHAASSTAGLCTAAHPDQILFLPARERPHRPDARAAGLGLRPCDPVMPPRDFDPATPRN